MCDEIERSLHDALCVVRRVLESKTVVVGGGAVEAALSIYLENFATSLVSELDGTCLNLPSVGNVLQLFSVLDGADRVCCGGGVVGCS